MKFIRLKNGNLFVNADHVVSMEIKSTNNDMWTSIKTDDGHTFMVRDEIEDIMAEIERT